MLERAEGADTPTTDSGPLKPEEPVPSPCGPNNFPEQGKGWAFGEVQLPVKPHKSETWLRPATDAWVETPLPRERKGRGRASHSVGSRSQTHFGSGKKKNV